MKLKTDSIKSTIHTVKHIMRFVWTKKYGKTLFCIKYLYALIGAVLSNIYIVIPGLLINELTRLPDIDIRKTVILLIAVLAFPPAQQLLSLFFEKIISDVGMKLDIAITQEYFNHISKMDYETLENPDVQLMQERAEGTLNNATSIIDKTSGLISAVISLIIVSSIISTLNPLIIVLICFIIFINSVMTKRANKKSFELRKDLDKVYRFQSFYPFALLNLDYAKEIRVFHLKDYLIKKYTDSVEESNNIQKKDMKNGRKLSAFTIFTSAITPKRYGCFISRIT